MARILNNKYAIGGLAILACTLVYIRVVGPAIDFFYPETVEADVYAWDESDQAYDSEPTHETRGTSGARPASSVDSDTDTELQFATEQFKLTKIDIRNLRWNDTPVRDPFSSITPTNVRKPLTKTKQQGTAKNLVLPRVSAIVRSPSLKFAVINGEILKEGDSYGDFTVDQIGETQIAVTNRATHLRHWLSVRE